MNMRTNVSLKKYTTMNLGGDAKFLVEINSIKEVEDIYKDAADRQLPIFVLGGGSNVVARDGTYNGIVLLNHIKGFEVLDDDGSLVTIRVGAGESWDDLVERTVKMGLRGIEAMSGIPGTVGAAPVQNIGAYGQELADVFVSLEAYDSRNGKMVALDGDDCQFSYRDSIFRGSEQGRYCITSVTLRLYRGDPEPPFYDALQRYFDERNITDTNLRVIRESVLAIRAAKLPDPAELPNSGSFFKNAIIESWQYDDLKKTYPDMPCYEMPGGLCKVPTGWLIDKAGLKGKTFSGMRVYDKNALVLVNDSAAGYDDLAAAREEITQIIYDMFHIQIQQEPLELG